MVSLETKCIEINKRVFHVKSKPKQTDCSKKNHTHTHTAINTTMFKTLGKEPVKFMFHVGLNSLEDLLLLSPTDSSISVKKKGGGLFKKKSKDAKGSDAAVDDSGNDRQQQQQQQYASEAELGISDKTQFVVHWSRGRKHSGKTEPKSLHSVSHKVVWMDDISIKGTLFRDPKRGAYSKKLLSLQIEEVCIVSIESW